MTGRELSEKQKGMIADMPDINSLLRSFDRNQLREINDFLNSAQGRKVKDKINSSDKNELLKAFSALDRETVNSKLKNLSKQDILKIINNL